MEYYEIVVTTLLKADITYTKSFEWLSNFINKAMLGHDDLKAIHLNKKLKLYTFSSFYPIEKDKTYKKGRVYIFRIRSIDKNFIDNLHTILKKIYHNDLHILSTELITKNQKFIKELISLTPIILSSDQGYHLPSKNQLIYVEERIKNLLERKYEAFYGEKIHVDQLCSTVVKANKVPIKLPYKNMHFIGNKFRFIIDESEASQKLATMALATSMSEKSSLGMGFAVANFRGR